MWSRTSDTRSKWTESACVSVASSVTSTGGVPSIVDSVATSEPKKKTLVEVLACPSEAQLNSGVCELSQTAWGPLCWCYPYRQTASLCRQEICQLSVVHSSCNLYNSDHTFKICASISYIIRYCPRLSRSILTLPRYLIDILTLHQVLEKYPYFARGTWEVF